MDEQRKSQARRLAESIGQGLAKRLRAREEEIDKIGKLNYALEERIKSLCIENQIWRDLAQANEATANALRTNLEQVLAQVRTAAADDAGETADLDDDAAAAAAANHRRNGGADDNALMEDAQSCCGSSGGGGGGWGEGAEDCGAPAAEAEEEEGEGRGREERRRRRGRGRRWWCRECGKEEARVLMLPCRHLCVCTACEPSCRACPVCQSAKNASFVVSVS